MFFCSCVGPCAKEAKSCQTQGNNYNLFASQLASLDFRTCENWVDINGIPIQEEKQLTSGWEDVLYSEESKTFALEIRISLLRVGSTGILKVWERTLVDYPQKHTIWQWVRNKIEISNFSRHFKALLRSTLLLRFPAVQAV